MSSSQDCLVAAAELAAAVAAAAALYFPDFSTD